MPAIDASSPAGIALPSESALTIASRAGSDSASATREKPDWTNGFCNIIRTPVRDEATIADFGKNSFQDLMKHHSSAACHAGHASMQ